MKKWVLIFLSIVMMLVLAVPALAGTGTAEAAQGVGHAAYTVEFTYDGRQYVMPGDSSVRLSAILDEIGLTGAVAAAEVSDASLFSASNETGEWVVTAHRAFSSAEWMKVTIDGVAYEITVTDDASDEWAALQAAINAATGDDPTIDVSAYAGADGRIKCPAGGSALQINKKITLDLKGCVIDRGLTAEADDGYVIEVGASGDLTVTDGAPNAAHDPAITYTDPIENQSITVTGGVITGGYNTGDGGGVYVANGGHFTVSNGIKISGNKAKNGGGVYVSRASSSDSDNKGGEFTMTGGEISGNVGRGVSVDGGIFKMEKGTISENAGGVYVYNNGSFTMDNGCEISGNTSSAPSGYGAGVYVVSGTFTMKGGTISNNSAGDCGGGVYVSSTKGNKKGEFTMTGGTISNNTAKNEGGGVSVNEGSTFTMDDGCKISENRATDGGGVQVAQGSFTMYGGEISRNTATSYNGGVGVYATFTMEGGTISSNNTAQKGGGVGLGAYGTIKLSGEVEISGNTTGGKDKNIVLIEEPMNTTNKSIVIEGTLRNQTPIGVSCGYEMTGPQVFTSGLPKYGTDGIFISEQGGYDILPVPQTMSGAGEAVLYKSAKVTFDANEGKGAMEAQTVIQKWAWPLNANAFTRRGHSYTGWNTAANGSGTGYPDKAEITLAGDVTLYAQWDRYKVDVGSIDDQTYTGKAIEPAPPVIVNGETLKKGTDYTFGYANNVNVGEATLTVNFAGDFGDYSAESVKFNITKANPFVTAPTANSLTYNKKEQALVNAGRTSGGTMQYALGTDEETAPTSGWDTPIPTATNTGTYYVWYKAEGDENHTDSKPDKVKVIISKAKPTANAPTGLTATRGQTLADLKLINPEGNTAGSWTWVDDGSTSVGNTGENTFKVSFAPTDATNYNSVSVDVTVKVDKADPIAKAPTVNATYGQTLADLALTNPEGNTTGTWTWVDPLTTVVGDVGEKTFKANFTPADTANYNSVNNADVTVKVGKSTSIINAPTGLTAIYGQTLADVTLTNPEGNPAGTWTWVDEGSTSVGNAGQNTFKTNFTPTDATNYNSVSNADVTVTVGKADPIAKAPTVNATYGQTLAELTLTNPEGNTAGSWTWVDDGSTSVGNVGENTFKATFTPADATNYNSVSDVAVTVTVDKAKSVPATVTANDRTYDGTEQALVTVDSSTLVGGTMWYAIGSVDAVPDFDGDSEAADRKWSVSVPAATNVETYTVYYMVKGDENHEVTEPASVTSVISPVDKEELKKTLEEAAAYHAKISGDCPKSAENLKKVIDEAQAVYDNDNVTAEQVKEQVEKLKAAMAAAAVSVMIEALPAPEDIILDHAEAVEATRTAYDALTEEQKALVDPELVEKLKECEKAIAAIREMGGVYYIYAGKNQDIVRGSGESLNGIAKRSYADRVAFERFTGIRYEGKDLDPQYYEAKAGSVEFSLKPAFLNSLELGEQKVTLMFKDGSVELPFRISAKESSGGGSSGGGSGSGRSSTPKADPEPTDVPQTGDKANIPLWIGMVLIGLLGIIGAGVAVLPKRKK